MLIKKRLALLLALVMAVTVLIPAAYARDNTPVVSGPEVATGQAVSQPVSEQQVGISVSSDLLAMTEPREIEVSVNLGYTPDLKNLEWTFGGKPFSEWKQWSALKRDYVGNPFITMAAEPAVEGSTVKAKIKFDYIYTEKKKDQDGNYTLEEPTGDLSGSSRSVYPGLIGEYNLAVKDKSTGIIATKAMVLKPYDSYHTYAELEQAVTRIQENVKPGRFFDSQVIGRTVEGRDMHFVVLAKDQASVNRYLNNTLPEMLENPAALQAKINDGTIGDYKVPVFFNNIHPDEAVGPDAVLELLSKFATQDTVAYKTKDAQGAEQDVTIDVNKALDNVIFLFDFTENPDGRVHNTRRNANGFDVNRDNGFQTQSEAQAVTHQIAKWTPVTFLDFHGFHNEFLIEPCTPPHDPNYEYDLLAGEMNKQAHLMGEAGIANTKYESYFIPLEGFAHPRDGERYVGWDDAAPNYTATYAMYHGALGHTIEIPDLNEDSFNALVACGLASTRYVLDNKDALFKNQLEIFKRGVAGEDNKAVDQWLVEPDNKKAGRPRGDNENFFPEYYALPVVKNLQKNSLEVYKMVDYLLRNGVKVEKTTGDVKAGNVTYPAGTYVVPLRQAKRAYANTVLYRGVDLSAWPDMYAETVMDFPDLWGFDRYEIRTAGVFDGKTEPVQNVTVPATIIPGEAKEYVIKAANNDAVRAVNRLLADGKTVKLLLAAGSGYEAGDYLVAKSDLEGIKNDYLLDVAPFTGEAPARTLVQPKVAAVGNGQTSFVLRELGFDLVNNPGDSDIIVDDSGVANKDDIKAGRSYIGIGGRALNFVKDANILPGFDFAKTEFSHEGLLQAVVFKDNLITAGYNKDELLYSASGSWITAVPLGAKVLVRVSSDNNFYRAGWWPGHEAVKGQVLAITGKAGDKNITLFASDLTNKAHPEHSFRLLANAVFASQVKEVEQAKSFEDIKGHWAKNEIEIMANKEIVKGMDELTFAPDAKITRAQFATMLFRVLGLQENSFKGTFKDVKAGSWYAGPVEAVAGAGIVKGSDGKFNPDQEISREAMAVMIVRAVEYKGIKLPEGTVSFKDQKDIAGWALKDVAKAVNKGIVRGMTADSFAPGANATRAQAAVMLYRLLQELGQI